MIAIDLAKSFRSLLADPTNEAFCNDLVSQVDARIGQITSSDDKKQAETDFEEELHKIYDEDVDFSKHVLPLELFLQILTHSQSVVPVSSIVSTWFDLVLRPALREPRLAPSSKEHAKELIVAGLDDDEDVPEKVQGFRRRLVDLFLLDALNESFGSDILEWVELNEQQRDSNRLWKQNLEDVLVKFGLLMPEPFLDTLLDCFSAATSRLQILMLLDSFAMHPDFIKVSSHLFNHPLMSSILRSLEVDNSSTVCAVAMSVVVKLLPVAALQAYDDLKRALPRLFAILGRILCWKAKGRSTHVNDTAYSDLVDHHESDSPRAGKEAGQLQVREELQWERLERTFDAAPSSAPVPKHFFMFLYYLFPCNLVFFLRNPAAYLAEKNVESPWMDGWEDVLDELLIRTAASSILRTCAMHPSVIWHDVQAELDDSERFASYNISKLVGECQMLEHRPSATFNEPTDSTAQQRAGGSVPVAPNPTFHDNIRHSNTFPFDESNTGTPTVRTVEIATGMLGPTFGAGNTRERRVSLQDIIDTSVALKTGSEIQVPEKSKAWPTMLFGPVSQATRPTQQPNREPTASSSSSTSLEPTSVPTQLTETIYGLQREVLLLRTELNFELWLKKENLNHIGRLHRDDVISKNAELERQRLHDRLREFRIQLSETQEELLKHREQSQDMKKKHVEWSTTLSSKLNGLRDEKKSWMIEATTLQTAKADVEARLAAQGNLLADAQKSIFSLQTQIKTDEHKVQRLRDYEQRIEQHVAMQRMWDKDIILYNEQSKRMTELVGEHQSMKLRVEAYEKAQETLDNEARLNRRKIQTLEAKLRASRKSSESLPSARLDMQAIANAHVAEKAVLRKECNILQKENKELRDDLEETQAMVEILKAQVSGTQGLVNPGALASAMA